ncbi:hypothetical protein [Allobranchiibius sp. CTAmp26]|uniref:hypothetical protein n=1 Tax=Allobranchiibius sp. CTAmp26 TaxID=2815214 RepID=UPI001AA0DC27|nr:hypothetical protein [Allobranchiibius sp. CTAmp26]MBO1754442.1 hypothetical protein [Allobranchiibius sp. CTAmp26]
MPGRSSARVLIDRPIRVIPMAMTEASIDQFDYSGEQFDFPTRSVCIAGVLCYIVGLLPLALRSGEHPVVSAGVWIPSLWFVGWHFVVVAVGILGSVRENFHLRGEPVNRALMYGAGWAVAGASSLAPLVANTYLQLSDDKIVVVAHAAAVGCSCTLFWAGAAMWGDRAQAAVAFVLGVGVFFAMSLGPGLYFWVMLIVMPLAFAVGALLALRHRTGLGFDAATR